MRNARRSKLQLKLTSANRARVFEFMERFNARHLYTIDGPAATDLDEIMAFAYEGGVAVVHTFEGVNQLWTLYTEPSVSGDLDELDSAMRLQIAERAEPGHPNAAYYAPLLCGIMTKLLVEVDGEIEQRKMGGNAEHWAALANLSSTVHTILAMVKAGSQPDPGVDHKLLAMEAVVLLAENQGAWEDEEDSVQREHRDLIARNNAALYGTTAPGGIVRIPAEGMTPDGFVENEPPLYIPKKPGTSYVVDGPLHLSKAARDEIEKRGGTDGLTVVDDGCPECSRQGGCLTPGLCSISHWCCNND